MTIDPRDALIDRLYQALSALRDATDPMFLLAALDQRNVALRAVDEYRSQQEEPSHEP